MKFRSRVARAVMVAALTVAALVVVVSPALADLEDIVTYESSTNPQVGENAWWRWGWGNDPRPHIMAQSVPQDTDDPRAVTSGMVYTVRQIQYGEDVATIPAAHIPNWTSSSLSILPYQTTFTGVYDISAYIARFGWTPTPGTTKRGEGLYRITNRYYNQFRMENAAAADAIAVGLDMTPPLPVSGLNDSVGEVDGVGTYVEATWRDLRWAPLAYDSLSGVGGFYVKVNDGDEVFGANVSPDPSYEPYASMLTTRVPDRGQLSHITIEDLRPGKNVITVTVVDRATNRSTPATVTAYVDPDTPQVKLTKPTNGLVPRMAKFSADASDLAGIAKVSFYMDGQLLGSDTTKPYEIEKDMSSFTDGPHTLKVVAEDMIGTRSGPWMLPHTAEVVQQVVVDNRAPSLTINSAGPSPFYPRKRDGYKDDFVMKFTTDEPGTAVLVVYNSKGKAYRQVSKTVTAGTSSIAWDGKKSDGTMAESDFKCQIVMYDAAGNWRGSSKYAALLRYTELVRVNSRTVKVIQR